MRAIAKQFFFPKDEIATPYRFAVGLAMTKGLEKKLRGFLSGSLAMTKNFFFSKSNILFEIVQKGSNDGQLLGEMGQILRGFLSH
jgi:hypothetical protein